MKKINLKKLLHLLGILFLTSVVMISCKKDKEDDDDKPDLVLDGYYLRGAATPFSDFDSRGLLGPGINEVDQNPRTGMYEMYMALKGNTDFDIVKKTGKTEAVYGPKTIDDVLVDGSDWQVNITIKKGTIGTDASQKFKVANDGLYHIVIDEQTNVFIIAPVSYAVAYGGVDTELVLDGTFNQTSMKYHATEVNMRTDNFKFRYGNGWKINMAEGVKVNANFGGVVSGTIPNLVTTLVPGGPDYKLAKGQEGKYTVALEWSIDEGFKSKLTRTGDPDPLQYPDELFMIGDGVGIGGDEGWGWNENDLPMVPVHSKPHLFWKIVWMHGTGSFKFAPQKDWVNDFGKTGTQSAEGIWEKGGDNVPVPSTAGYYMVIVNLETDQIAVVDPEVYLIGNTVGSWDGAVPANKFTIDNTNQVITITKDLAEGGLRMHAWSGIGGWLEAWWHLDFNIIDGNIVFRGDRKSVV